MARRHGVIAAAGLCAAGLITAAIFMGPREPADPCARPAPGSALAEPTAISSSGGVLRVELGIRNHREPDGSVRYCYVTPDGAQAPTLRVHPGDELRLRLTNKLAAIESDLAIPGVHGPTICRAPGAGPNDPCAVTAMTPTATNLHFHGLTVPPACHQDDVLHTAVEPGDDPFDYRFRILDDEPPGLYWYHPHIHGYSGREVSGGASGALVIEGIERAMPKLAGLPERLFVIRDQALVHPDAAPSKSEPVVPKSFFDRDGDVANNGTGFGKPARDLSVNFVTVPYPDYPTPTLRMKPGERQLWRVLNASSLTYLDVALLFGRVAQRIGVVAIDGAPLNGAGSPGPDQSWVDHIEIPPGGRAEFIVDGPPAGTPAWLVTRFVDTGPVGENDPNRALVSVIADPDAAAPAQALPRDPRPLPPSVKPWLGTVQPVRVRRFYFSETPQDPADPNSPTTFYLTEDGHQPAPFDPMAREPNIVARQGEVEDWIIENRSTELHAFHIHQLHFQLVGWMGYAVNEPFLRDTVNVPYDKGNGPGHPSVRLRMDFRDPTSVGTFAYHCHLLEHEDGGMMGTIRVDPAETRRAEGDPPIVR